MRNRPGSVEKIGHYRWIVTIAGAAYTAVYDSDPETFVLDRWTITNSRGQRKGWDSRISSDVQHAIRASSPIA